MATKDRVLFTYADYLEFPEDGKRHEIIGGDHYMSASPVTRHQRVSGMLHYELVTAIDRPGRGQVFAAPTTLLLSEHDIVEPDLMVILAGSLAKVERAHVAGPPDLVVEIRSPSTELRDAGIKKRLYERVGVREYWIVDPNDCWVEQHVLEDGHLRSTGRHRESLALAILPDVPIDLRLVWPPADAP